MRLHKMCRRFFQEVICVSKVKLSVISTWHYVKLVFRSLMFLAGLTVYILHRRSGTGEAGLARYAPVLIFLWVMYAISMTLRFFPSPTESMGCQKQFARNYKPIPAGKHGFVQPRKHGTMMAAASWVVLNGLIGLIYFLGWIDKGILMLISLAYGVCDMICILFFCPFQTWMMKNKCCNTCRIYNWDYAMMFTPMLFIGGFWAWSLLGMSLVLMARWEITFFRHPERFLEACNDSLACRNCQEKLCSHKKQLQHLLKELKR